MAAKIRQTPNFYRGHMHPLKLSTIDTFSIDEKKPQNVQNSFMTIVETPVVAILFFKIRPNIFQGKLL